jgi:hypothetical protein
VDSVLAEGPRWLIVLGVLGTLVAASVGFLDRRGERRVPRPGRHPDRHAGVPDRAGIMGISLAVTAAYTAGYLMRGAHPARRRRHRSDKPPLSPRGPAAASFAPSPQPMAGTLAACAFEA